MNNRFELNKHSSFYTTPVFSGCIVLRDCLSSGKCFFPEMVEVLRRKHPTVWEYVLFRGVNYLYLLGVVDFDPVKDVVFVRALR